MKPKKKAKELVEIYAEIIEPIQYELVLERNWNNAKQCALRAVYEIIKEKKECSKYECYGNDFAYWQEVKQEIENL